MSLHWSEDEWRTYQASRGIERLKAQPVTEKAFMGAIITIARKAGCLVYHTWLSKRSPEGFPDLVLVHPTRLELPVFCIELKTATGQVTPAQQAWVDALDGRTTVAAVWRPDALPMITRWLTTP